jgi:N-acetylneuraminic acid mutarotase
MRSLRAFPVLCLLIAVIALTCGKDAVVTHNTGGSEVVGRLVTKTAASVANARIFAFKIPSDTSIAAIDLIPFDTAFSNDKGQYKFTKLDIGFYRLFASGKYAADSLFASHDRVLNDYIAPPSEPTRLVEVGTDTMRAPGSISGKVILDPLYSGAAIYCYIPGSSFDATADDSGVFLMTNVPAGVYNLYYRDLSNLYAVAIDSNIKVVSDSVTRLAAKKLQLSTDKGPPAPVRIRATYDTIGGQVALSWNKVNVADLEEYLVFRKESAQDSFVPIGKTIQPETTFVDTVYRDSHDTAAHTYMYELYSKDIGGEPGSHSEIVPVPVISPSAIRTVLFLKVDLDTVAIFDKKTIVCDYTNGMSIVDSLVWGLEKPDSIVKRVKKGSNSGSDTINILWGQPGIKTVYCSSRDASGKKRTDSISVIVISDVPYIRYVSPDTAIEFGGMFRCSLAVYHRFGNCTLLVDLNRDNRYEFKKIGLALDTLFSTNTDTLGGKVKIRIIDAHKNTVDTFFTLKINPAPQHDKWIECDSMATPRKFLSVCVVGKNLYAIGGCNRFFNGTSFVPQATNAVESFDSAWTAKDTLKTARHSFACVPYQNSIYVFGGTGNKGFVKSIERYDITANKWSTAGNMPVFRAGAGSCVLNNKLYLFGGRAPYQSQNDSVSNCIYSYDFTNNQWSGVIGRMNTPRYYFQAIAINDKILLIGGYGGAFFQNDTKILADVEVFDTSSNQCAPHSILNAPRSCFGTVAIKNAVYIIGGISGTSGNTLADDISQYNTSEKIWKTVSHFSAPHSGGRHGCGADVLGGSIVIVGGGTDLSKENAGYADGVVRKYYP